MRIARFGPWRPATGWHRLAERGLRAVVPENIPDLDPAYEQVTHWWLELNEEGQVTREIGFDRSGRAIAAASLGDNRGIFTESDQAPHGLGEPVSVTEFERAWFELSAKGV